MIKERERTNQETILLDPPQDEVSLILHNDDKTPIDFVIVLLHLVCGKSKTESINIAVEANDCGSALIQKGPYKKILHIFEIAKDVISKSGFPLKITIEE
jgi:ATP-dependent Clp protease adaptor protein ClpS